MFLLKDKAEAKQKIEIEERLACQTTAWKKHLNDKNIILTSGLLRGIFKVLFYGLHQNELNNGVSALRVFITTLLLVYSSLNYDVVAIAKR